MKKILFSTICLIFLLTGCNSQYNLEINNGTFKETIVSDIYPDSKKSLSVEGIEEDDQITPFLEMDQYPFSNDNNIVYSKTIEMIDDYQRVTLKYKYNENEFENSKAINNCFENYRYFHDDKYIIELSGTFYCLYTDSLDINIKTDYKVLENNADDVNNNIYTWHINRENLDDVSLRIVLDKSSMSHVNDLLIFIIIIFIILIFVISYIMFRKIKQKNSF